MCGRYTFTQLPAQEAVALSESGQVDLRPRYNVAPSQPGLVRPSHDAAHYHLMRWGLIPHWAKDPKIGYKLINARLETVLEKPAFRQGVRQRRIAVWADGFYEWKKTGSRTQPYRIVLCDAKPFHFAGLAERWHSPEGEWIDSYTILTCPPNDLMANLHNRMPVLLAPDQVDAWLDPQADTEQLVADLGPYPSEAMRAYPVDARVGNVYNDAPNLVEPIASQGRLF